MLIMVSLNEFATLMISTCFTTNSSLCTKVQFNTISVHKFKVTFYGPDF